MAHNTRYQQPPSRVNTRPSKKEEPQFDLIRLTDKEIALCISEIGIPLTVENVMNPNPVHVQMVLEWFAEKLLNATRTTVEPAMRAAAEETFGEHIEAMPPDTRNLMGFYAQLRILLDACGVPDLGFNDLYRPTHGRLVKIFSYMINFVRFKQEQSTVIDRFVVRGDEARARIEHLDGENARLDERLSELRATRRAMETRVLEQTARNDEFKKKLLELNRTQAQITARLEDARKRRNDLQQRVKDREAAKLQATQECSKLRPYATQSPAALQENLADLGQRLAVDKSHIDALDRRARALQTSADSFAVVEADVASCIKMLEEVAAEIAQEDAEVAKHARQRDALGETGNEMRKYERQEAMLRKQLAKWQERTEKLRAHSREYALEAKEKMETFSAQHHQLSKEQTHNSEEIERRRVRIEQTEKKMLDLKENIEAEIHAAQEEWIKLESHVKLYITEMEQAL